MLTRPRGAASQVEAVHGGPGVGAALPPAGGAGRPQRPGGGRAEDAHGLRHRRRQGVWGLPRAGAGGGGSAMGRGRRCPGSGCTCPLRGRPCSSPGMQCMWPGRGWVRGQLSPGAGLRGTCPGQRLSAVAVERHGSRCVAEPLPMTRRGNRERGRGVGFLREGADKATASSTLAHGGRGLRWAAHVSKRGSCGGSWVSRAQFLAQSSWGASCGKWKATLQVLGDGPEPLSSWPQQPCVTSGRARPRPSALAAASDSAAACARCHPGDGGPHVGLGPGPTQ